VWLVSHINNRYTQWEKKICHLLLRRGKEENPNAHMELAEIYQKKGEKQKAISEYLLTAEIFSKNQFYARAISVYKQLSKRDPYLDQVYLRMAEIYREKGFLAESLAQYRILAHYYEKLGEKDKALHILEIMDKANLPKTNSQAGELPPSPSHSDQTDALPPQETASGGFFDLSAALTEAGSLEMDASKEDHISEGIDGAERVFKELQEIGGPDSANPYFHYNMGMAYHELGYFNEAFEQFELASKTGQKVFEALSMLGFGYWEKGMYEDAQRSFKKALGMEKLPQEKGLSAKYILSLLYQELGRKEMALSLLQEIATADKAFLSTQDEPMCPADKSGVSQLTCSNGK
jgi:tetratricopeptide (TPR) repeat protein